MRQERPEKIYRWALRYLLPYRRRLTILCLVTGVEILSGLLLPWPLKFIVDHALGDHPTSGLLASITGFFGSDRVALLILGCVTYLILHYASEFISVAHTQMQ
jgi:ABC-type multidrug transport system fused ATPase/permease subunit